MKSPFSARNILEQIENKERCFLVNQDILITEEIKKLIEDENWKKLEEERQYREDSRVELENLLAQSEKRLKECEMRLLHNEKARSGLEALIIQSFLQTNDMEAMYDENIKYDDDKKLELFIEDMRNLKDNCANKVIAPNRKHFNKPIIFFKRIIRKLIRWYVDPVAERQALFNNSVFSYARESFLLNTLLIKKIDELSRLSDQNKQEIKKNKDVFTKSVRRIHEETIKSLDIFIHELNRECPE
ncbi:MAG: hypothetical protein LBG43_09370 [Treponema sp.]|jgi:hypothetical protein|nr:hypothetical protein [Treponema sp.]